MKVAILSMQEIKNYGSFLQAFALKSTIGNLGHEVKFLPVKPGVQLPGNKSNLSKWNIIKRFIGLDFYKRIKYSYKFHNRFNKEFHPLLDIRGGKDQRFDIAVIGSDEVFNCLQKSWLGFSLQLFGVGLNASKVITYAGSFGATTSQKLKEFNVHEDVAAALNKLSAISVRDQNSLSTINELTGREACLNVDPVFIYDYKEHVPSDVPYDNYILIYSYPNRLKDKHIVDKIKKFAREKGLKLISVGHYFPWCDKTITPNPFEVLSLFKKAEYIITDTFHGSVISIKYNKKFCTVIRQMNNNKLQYLLKQFGLEDRIWNDEISLEDSIDNEIDYVRVNKLIDKEIHNSLSYLKKEIV